VGWDVYNWRKLTAEQREEVLERRKAITYPWHSPPHQFLPGTRQYIVSAACYEHAEIIGHSAERMTEFSRQLCSTCNEYAEKVFAWCVLPNHYHVVLQTDAIKHLFGELGRLHGRTSFQWNGQENLRGRQVWFNAVERGMRCNDHLWASINYVHHNPVKHGYAERWQDWAWSSASSFLDEVGVGRATEVWRNYPVLDYGNGWDD
jgi:putative transposase